MKIGFHILGFTIGIIVGFILAVFSMPSERDLDVIINRSNVIRSAYEQDHLLEIVETGIHMRCNLMQRVQFNHDGLTTIDRGYLGGDAKEHALQILDSTIERFQTAPIQKALSRC